MSRGTDTPGVRSWAYPDCPTCGTDVFVDQSKGDETYVCQSCRTRWSE